MLAALHITDLSGTEIYADSPETTYKLWISLIDKEDEDRIKTVQKKLNQKNIEHHYHIFYDFSDEDSDPFIKKNIEKLGPQKGHIKRLIDIIKSKIDRPQKIHLAINCYAGISRSTALGIISLTLAGRTPTQALNEVLNIRPQAWPNLRMLRFASEILQKDLVSPIKTWKNEEKNQGIYIPLRHSI
jgi:predicted protein tyrosine phosphatase